MQSAVLQAIRQDKMEDNGISMEAINQHYFISLAVIIFYIIGVISKVTLSNLEILGYLLVMAVTFLLTPIVIDKLNKLKNKKKK